MQPTGEKWGKREGENKERKRTDGLQKSGYYSETENNKVLDDCMAHFERQRMKNKMENLLKIAPPPRPFKPLHVREGKVVNVEVEE